MLKIGDPLPYITLPNEKGENISLSSFKGKQPIVVYFYPKNNTPGCTAEACSFRDNYESFKDFGAEIIGISGDSVSSHQKVKNRRKLPFILLSDSQRKAERLFGVPRSVLGLLPGRVTFIADKSGKIVHTFNSTSNATRHISEALKALSKAN
ncbi:MAG: peroxiredoxin [Bacteroidota bacterium]